MAFSFKSVGHMLATGIHDFYSGLKAIDNLVLKIDTPENVALVTGLTQLVPGFGMQAATVERGLAAVAGEVAAVLGNVTAGGEKKLLDAGFDAQVIADFKTLIAGVPGLLKGGTVPVATTPATPQG